MTYIPNKINQNDAKLLKCKKINNNKLNEIKKHKKNKNENENEIKGWQTKDERNKNQRRKENVFHISCNYIHS